MLFFATKTLSAFDNPRLEAEVLLSSVFGIDRASLRTHLQEVIPFSLRWKFFYFVSLRAKHVPIAYIRGWKDWCGMRILVTPSVLIPRDETEILIQKITTASLVPQTILDVGTGSGCIALVLAKSFDTAKVTAVDVSKAALQIAKKNFKNHGGTIELLHSDLLSAIPQRAKFDLIVVNLPYVPISLPVTKSVQKEPQEAIFSGKDGLDLLRRFARELGAKEVRFKALWIEFLPQQWEEIQNIWNQWKVEPHCDLGGDIYFAKITEK